MTLENMLPGTGDFAAMCDQVYGIRKDRTLYASGSGPMEIDLKSLKDREQTGELTMLRLAASRKVPNSIIPVASIIDETGDFQVIDKALASSREIDALIALVRANPDITAKELAREVPDNTERTVKNKLFKFGWHCTVGGANGKSPWHQDIDGKCPFDKRDVVEVKPSKKTFDKTLPEAVKFLAKVLAGTGPDTGEAVYESEVYREADEHGYTDAMIAKAKKRLGVVVEKADRDEEGDGLGERMWSLPEAKPTSKAEPKEQTVAA